MSLPHDRDSGFQAATRPKFRLTAEWQRPAAVWLAWPHNQETWPNRFDAVPEFYRGWVRLISESTPVHILAAGDAFDSARATVGQFANVQFHDVPTNDCWIRDYAPSFVVKESARQVVGVHWRYNAWGGKYPPWDLDRAAGRAICQRAGIDCVASELCLEGGAIEADGSGRLLTTTSCLITPTRNPGWTKEQIAHELYRQLGIMEIVWLDGGGLAGDDTDGHVDQLARFVDSRHVVVAVCDDPQDPNTPRLEENYRQLHLWADATTPAVQVHRLPIPPARFIAGQRVPESYCNFQRLGQERLLMPTFGAKTDAAALGLLRELTSAEVIGVDCRDLVWGLGALHCASREQPALG
ncbi:MAG: agmatine deiminase family protein [Pirellulales bacterium]|nr:agmatine deiminase family protein [Pirellulales bacterium]